MTRDLFGFRGRTVVVAGAASGMGQATARLLVELGAEVYALDVKHVTAPVRRFISMDLLSEQAIDAAVSRLPGSIDSLFNCAGLPGPPWTNVQVVLANFVGAKHLTEALLPRIPDGGSVAIISSAGGLGWRDNLSNVKDLLAIESFAQSREWLEKNEAVNNGYVFSKQCAIVYCIARASELSKRRVRINALSPGGTATPMMDDFHRIFTKEVCDQAMLGNIGRYATPEEIAEAMVFLNSDMARYISGHNLVVDYGGSPSREVGELG